MELILETQKDQFGTAETVTVRLMVLNNSYEPPVLDRRLLVGPNPVPDRLAGAPFPVSLEPAFPQEEQNLVVLNPWCLYGRQRPFVGLPPGRLTFHGYLLRRPLGSLLPEKPRESDALLVSAEPLVVTIQESR